MLSKKRKFIFHIFIVSVLFCNTHTFNINNKNNSEIGILLKDNSIKKPNVILNDKEFIVIDFLNINENLTVYFGYYRNGLSEVKIQNSKSTETISLIHSWNENIPKIDEYFFDIHNFKLYEISDIGSGNKAIVLVDFIHSQGDGGNFHIWTLTKKADQYSLLNWNDWLMMYEIYLYRSEEDIVSMEIPYFNLKETFHIVSWEDTVNYLNYLSVPIKKRVPYNYNYYTDTVGCNIYEDSIVVRYSFRTGTHDWIPDIKITYKIYNNSILALDADFVKF